MSFALIQRSDTFFQGQQRLIDFGSINPGLFVLVHVVSSSLTPSQVNKRYLPMDFLALFEGDLQDGVGT